MTVHDNAERTIINYLLGGLTEEEEACFEDSYFNDDAQFEQLRGVKQELVDAYVRGHLDVPTRERFERHFLGSAAGRQQVAFAQALRQNLNARAAADTVTARPWLAGWRERWSSYNWLLAAAATALVLISALGWFYRENRRLRQELAQVQNTQAESARQMAALQQALAQVQAQPTATPAVTPPTPGPKASTQPKPVAIPALVLLPFGRSNDVPEVRVPAAAPRLPIQLTLNFDPGATACTAVLRGLNGAVVARHSKLRARKSGDALAVIWTLAAAALPPGEYEVTLTGQAAGQQLKQSGYRFRVVR
ncbi:MAG: hypothetical protein HYR56_21310 [Acidobacteria bacterium]|nr:hypothetical protein [Acidobacteriota bacterium]MBI3421589.1 hypothetical protein [Acidobacteriota bacterium]